MIDLRFLFRGRRRARAVLEQRLPQSTYVELVQSLFTHVIPAAIMTVCFAGTGGYIVGRHPDGVLILLYTFGMLSSVARLAVLYRYGSIARSAELSARSARAIERRFGVAYLGFAAALGLFAAIAYRTVEADMRVLLVALIFGYGAGAAATLSLRPRISVTAITIAIVPTILAAFFEPGVPSRGTAVLTLLFLSGGIVSMLQRYREASTQISLRRLMEKMARQNDLTGLPNRLVLRERFEELAARSDGTELIAAHRIDINRLNPVNEAYGHMAGDELLKAVAQRLRRAVRGDNIVIHLNDDDFVIIQPDMAYAEEAAELAHYVVAQLDKSYAVAGEDIIISANIGYAVDVQAGAELEELLMGAERALVSCKRQSSGVAAYDRSRWDGKVRLPG